jgi:hypothetical protein
LRAFRNEFEEQFVIMVRRVGAAILAVAAFAVWFLLAPDEPVVQAPTPVSDRSSEIDAALSAYELNNARTQGAPQQAVVNGWLAKDLLTTMAEQQNEALTREAVPPPVFPSDDRIPALAGLLVLGLALALVTSDPRTADADPDAGAPGAQRDRELAAWTPQTS